MKRVLALAGLLVVGALIFSSCRKCADCTAYDRSDNSIVNTTEYCGPSRIVEDDCDFYEDLWTDTYYYAECN